ncbi:MAG: bacterial Ig-like domain-containing protein [Oscillospiraceae bacterium]|nr:bacterial Ig-like domain-containing protein [Oscillospiraceae bacterium]
MLTSVANALDESESDNVTFVANMKTQAFASQLNRNINTDEYATWLWNADYYQGYPYHEPRTVQSIYVSRKPTKTAYRAGERFDPKGMVISALCNDGSSFAISSSELTYRPNTALTEGTKYVTAFYDSFSVQVSISVGANTNEYEITSLTMENASGTALSKMPKSVFYVTAAVKRLKDGSDMRVVIASYDAEGRFTGLAFVRVDMPVGATTYVSIPVDNSDGEIAEIKAFVLSSSGSLNPLSDPLSLK